MKQIVRCVIDRGGKVRLIDTPRPICGDKEILVANENSLISIGTEIQMAKMDTASAAKTTLKDDKLKNTVLNMFKSMRLSDFIRVILEELKKGYPMGYAGAGRVIEIGSEVTGINIGDRVAYGGSGHADIVKVPQNLFVKLPDNVDCAEGAFVTLGSIAMQGVRQSKLGMGETVLVYGLGLVGLLTIQILSAYGFKVIGIDIDDTKIKLAYEFGAEICYNGKDGKGSITEKIMEYTKGYGVDGVIVCAAGMKDSNIINHSFEITRKKGRIVIVGKVGLDLERKDFYNKEIELTISCSYGPGRYDDDYEKKGLDYPFGYVRWTENRNMQEFVDLISLKKVNVKPFITDEISINSSEEVYLKIQKDTNYNPIGVLLAYNNHNYEDSVKKIKIPSYRIISKKTLNLGLIGCGNFSRTMLMPNFSKSNSFNFYAVADIEGPTAMQFGKRYKLAYATTDYKELIKDENIDVIYISTRHNTHQAMSVETLNENKSVICEKPMAMNLKELDELREVIEKTNNHFHVGYNRRYTDFALKSKTIIDNNKAVVKITVNNKKMPKDSWQLDPNIGGGRLVGEACHFIDLANFLIGRKAKYVYASALNDSDTNIISNNNFIVTITYEDGSLGQVIYTDLGTPTYPKERIEVHSNNSIIEIIDFKEMRVFGKNKKTYKKQYIDKGHFKELEEIGNVIIGKSSCIVPTLSEYYYTSNITFKAIESMRSNTVIPL